MSKRKPAKRPKPPAKHFVGVNGLFERVDGKPVTWKQVDALLAALEKAGFVYGGGLHRMTKAEADAHADTGCRPVVTTQDSATGNVVTCKILRWTTRTG